MVQKRDWSSARRSCVSLAQGSTPYLLVAAGDVPDLDCAVDVRLSTGHFIGRLTSSRPTAAVDLHCISIFDRGRGGTERVAEARTAQMELVLESLGEMVKSVMHTES